MIEYTQEKNGEAQKPDASKIIVVGVGGAGSNVLDRISMEGMTDAELVTLNTDSRALARGVPTRKLQIGNDITRGLGAGGDPELGRDAARADEAAIRKVLDGRDMVFISVGLGGGTGSGAAPFIAQVAQSMGAFVVVFATLPFNFEGRRRVQQAEGALSDLMQNSNALVTFENDRMGQIALAKDGIGEAFEAADIVISQSVRAITRLVTKPGLIRIGMDDIKSALGEAGSRCLFGHGQASGKTRGADALKEALKSPLLDRGTLLRRSDHVIVHICGGKSMTLHEVDGLMKEINKLVPENAQILFGVADSKKMEDALSVTIITSLKQGDKTGAPDNAQSSPGIAAAAPSFARPKVTEAAPTPAAQSTSAVASPSSSRATDSKATDQQEKTSPAVSSAPEISKTEESKPTPIVSKTVEEQPAKTVEEQPADRVSSMAAPENGYLDDIEEPEVPEPKREEAKGLIASSEEHTADEDQSIEEADAVEEKNNDASLAQIVGSGSNRQESVPEIAPSKGNGEPTVVQGDDLEIPTFLRKNKG